MHTERFFNQLQIFMHLYQHTKNRAIPSIHYGDITDLKILQPDWLIAFSPISFGTSIFKFTTNNLTNIRTELEEMYY